MNRSLCHYGRIALLGGALLGSAAFTSASAEGLLFAEPVAVTAGGTNVFQQTNKEKRRSIMQNTEIAVDFARGKWNPADWMVFKSVRFDYTHEFVQMDDHIQNPCPPGLSDEEIYAKHVTDVYASIVWPERLVGSTIQVSSTMSFDHLMAPLIVITPELDKDDQGRPAFKKHYEVVLYNEGLNVWHYTYENGKLSWHLAAFARAPFEPNRRYELKVTMARGKREMRMTVECGGVKFGFEDPELPSAFYAGVTGCEGRNRFYDFKAKTSDGRLDPSSDGEH